MSGRDYNPAAVKTAQIKIKATPAWRELAKAAAARRGYSLGNWVRQLVDREIAAEAPLQKRLATRKSGANGGSKQERNR
jgi:uncharacterized protein (DUF1778 family)